MDVPGCRMYIPSFGMDETILKQRRVSNHKMASAGTFSAIGRMNGAYTGTKKISR